MQVYSLSNRGMERSRNEDSCFAEANADYALLVVADGMGGHQAGNVASALAVETARDFWSDLAGNSSLSAEETRRALEKLILDANRAIIAEAAKNPAKKGMGTTLTAGFLRGERLVIAHVGDSRAYRICNGKIEQLTKDHSLLEQLLNSGQIEPEEAENHPQRHVLTRAVGIDDRLEVDIYEKEIETGSVLLFCTDGLTNHVNDQEIKSVCLEQQDPQAVAESLIDLANDRGGHDNITVVIAAGIGGQHL